MIREDFILMNNNYQVKVNDVLVQIRKDAMNEKTVDYANKILNWYLSNKYEIIKYILNEGVLEFYGDDYTEEEIIEKLHEANITFIEDNWGTFTWLNHELDEHIIQVEFGNGMQLSYVSIDG